MSYGYQSEIIPLDLENILGRVTEEDIYALVFNKEDVYESSKVRAPYRQDSNPSCTFHRYGERLYFIDFADTEYHTHAKDCINVIERKFNFKYKEALEYINEQLELGLGPSTKVSTPKPILYEINYEIPKPRTEPRKILIYPRNFNIKDKEYWYDRYGITREQLIEDKVIPLTMFTSTSIKGEFFSIKPRDVMYSYSEFPSGNMKIYRPLSVNGVGKWFTNCNQNDVGNLHNIQDVDYIIITKSYKDCRVLRNLGYNCIWFQNEGMLPSTQILLELVSKYKNIFIWFDNDNAGLSKGIFVKEVLESIANSNNINCNVKNVFLYPSLLSEGVKDPSDCYYIKGKEYLINFANSKIIY